MSRVQVPKEIEHLTEEIRASIRWCLTRYMTRGETIEHVCSSTESVTHSLVEMMWNVMEQEHPKFFKAYTARALLHKQVNMYNELLRLHSRTLPQPDPLFPGDEKGKGVEYAVGSISVTQEVKYEKGKGVEYAEGSMSVTQEVKGIAGAQDEKGNGVESETGSMSINQEDKDMAEAPDEKRKGVESETGSMSINQEEEKRAEAQDEKKGIESAVAGSTSINQEEEKRAEAQDKKKGIESAVAGSTSINQEEEGMAEAQEEKGKGVKPAAAGSTSTNQEDEDMTEPEKETAFDLNTSPQSVATDTNPAVEGQSAQGKTSKGVNDKYKSIRQGNGDN